jgi:hypothetical protein
MSFIPKINEFDEYLEKPKFQQIVNDSFNSYKERGFLIENVGLFTASKYAVLFLGIVSVVASLPMITNSISLMVIGQKVITSEFSVTVGLVVFGILGVGLLSFAEYYKQMLFAKIVSHALKHKKAQFEIICFWVLLLGFSVYTAIEGSAEVAKFSSEVKAGDLQDTDKIRGDYDAQIKDIDKQIADAKKTGSGYTWNGALTDKGRAHISKLNGQKDKILDNKMKDIEGANTSNETTQNAADKQGNSNANLVRLVVALIEIFILFGRYYTEKYKHTVFMEVSFNLDSAGQTEKQDKKPIQDKKPVEDKKPVQDKEPIQEKDKAQQNLPIPTANIPKESSVSASIIGFKQYEDTPQMHDITEVETDKEVGVGGQKNCLHCGTAFTVRKTNHVFCNSKCRIENKNYPSGVKKFYTQKDNKQQV